MTCCGPLFWWAQLCSSLLVFFFSSFPCLAGDTDTYQQQLVEKAEKLRLWQSRQWRALLHMPLAESGESRIDSPGFFLSANGVHNPTAEGAATLASFFDPTSPGREGDHPQCRYPARYQWLKTALSFDSELLFEQRCPQLTLWIDTMDPVGATLIFPEAYLNNPASMFGHTFIRIEQNNGRSALLAPSVGFAAITDEQPGVGYAVKGLFGGYYGEFTTGLYVDQVRAYGALENRDIYEYRLGLTAAEATFLLLHVWELQRATFDYFFIDENCSYQLLALLEVARPSLDCTAQARFAAIPVETIRLLTAAGLVDGVAYRPSKRNVLRQRVRSSSHQQKELVIALARGGIADKTVHWNGESDDLRAEILEASIDLFLYEQAVTHGKHDADSPVLRHLLSLRSQLQVPPRRVAVPMPAVRPDQGHGAARISSSVGVDATDAFFEVGLRPVLHDLLDPGPGYIDGAQIDFLSARLRYYGEQNQLRLQTLNLLDIVSLAPMDTLVNPVSWKTRIGMQQMRYTDVGDQLTGQASVGLGASKNLAKKVQGFFLLEGDVLVSDRFDYGWNVNLGPVVGVLSTEVDRWSFLLQARAGYNFLHYDSWIWSLQFIQALHVAEDFSLRLAVTREQEFADPITETVFSMCWYF